MALARYQRRLATALAGIVNILDPDVIVLGGGLSSISQPVRRGAEALGAAGRGAGPEDPLLPARFGPESGLRGAAWLGGRVS